MEDNDPEAREAVEPAVTRDDIAGASSDGFVRRHRRAGEGRAGRIVASALLAVGLLTLGGAAVVNAASPTPGASAAASAGTSGGTGANGGHSCP